MRGAGWIGAVYGVQLSLLVLALLWIVGYNYLQHPDGPAMMAIIISSTAVARDAFEIGHVRKLAVLGRPFLTFPDGAALRTLVQSRPSQLAPWGLVGLGVGGVLGLSGHAIVDGQMAAVVQLLGITILGGGLALCAYFGGLRPSASWLETLKRTAPTELFKYWWWPGMAFASTYYLVVMGLVLFAWLTAQNYFKDSTNIDIRKVLLEEQNMLIDEQITPFGIIDDGRQEEIDIDGNDLWSTRGYTSSVF